jgi:hypothetical protein
MGGGRKKGDKNHNKRTNKIEWEGIREKVEKESEGTEVYIA